MKNASLTSTRLLYGRLMAIVVALIIVATDRLTKVMIQHAMNSYDDAPVIPGFLRITHVENPGAAFGFLAQGNPLLRNIVLLGITFVVICFVSYALWSRKPEYSGLSSRFALGLILGGALGNFLDRVFRGTVTDFIEVYHGLWTFPAFNIADSAITIGGALLVLEMFRPHPGIKAQVSHPPSVAGR